MNVPETVLVTVASDSEYFEADMELPGELPVKELKAEVMNVLRNEFGGSFTAWKSCSLEYRNITLNDEDTLISAGVFDGSRLLVYEEGQ